jgi:quercetin dioxygenase-like cupin family protein
MKYADRNEFEQANMFGTGALNSAFAPYFVGNSYLKAVASADEAGVALFNVTFEPGCRNNWHVHHATQGGGQVLICTAGEGWYQEWGKEPVELTPGTVICIPPETKHWHGAKSDSWFSHLTYEIPGEGTSNEWLEPVSDEDYDALGA